jgi:hypothetical protein
VLRSIKCLGKRDRFVVMPSEQRVIPEIERVVKQTDRYWVVEKLGTAAAVAAADASDD